LQTTIVRPANQLPNNTKHNPNQIPHQNPIQINPKSNQNEISQLVKIKGANETGTHLQRQRCCSTSNDRPPPPSTNPGTAKN